MINFGPTLNLLGGFQDPIQFDYIDLFLNGLRSPTRRLFCNIHRYSSPKLKSFFFQFLLFFALAQTKNIDTEYDPRSTCGCFRQSGHHPGRFRPAEKTGKTQRFFLPNTGCNHMGYRGWVVVMSNSFFYIFLGPF